MTDIQEVLREMREWDSVASREWADAIEAAMREPVAEVIAYEGIKIVNARSAKLALLPLGTKLYALPPDQSAEIERLRADLETAERALDAQTDFRAEIERLRADRDKWRRAFAADRLEKDVVIEQLQAKLQRLQSTNHHIAAMLSSAERAGSEMDRPEGTRYITLSDTLARQIAKELTAEDDEK
jgi:hypothetical protein